MKWRRRAALRLAAIALLSWQSAPAAAELVLLVGGGFIKVDGFHREKDKIRLLLRSGGVLTLSVLRIERIVADEVVESHYGDLAITSALAIDYRDDQGIPTTPYGELIYRTAARHAINPALVAAMVQTESAFDPNAVSRKGAAGLLQLMPATARRFGLDEREIFDPQRNLEAGVRYIRWLSERFGGELPLVLAGYNAGEATVERYGGVPPFKETREYIERVYSAADPSPGG